ncbi:PglD-related sugar-binding protein [Brumimicrobium mesophilum]|uniref:PglD-related sugar-binding protein n=1 Tax=Brumimicrobium mesophilum TaxID=392717 RepID=UPI00131BC5C0|nr:sialic acid O-acetyltransferase [Brumimicrobium mesophilum]
MIILGGGAFAREIYDLAKYCYGNDEDFNLKGFISEKEDKIEFDGYAPIINTITDYKIEKGDVFFCGIGNVKIRKKCVKMILEKGGEFINLIHPNTVISPSVKLGTGIGIKAYCVIASDAIIEDYAFIQSSVIMGHDVRIGKYSQINSFSFFAGKSEVKEMVLVGAHSKFIQGAIAEDSSTIGMGSLIIRKVKKNTTVFGSPAKVVEF